MIVDALDLFTYFSSYQSVRFYICIVYILICTHRGVAWTSARGGKNLDGARSAAKIFFVPSRKKILPPLEIDMNISAQTIIRATNTVAFTSLLTPKRPPGLPL